MYIFKVIIALSLFRYQSTVTFGETHALCRCTANGKQSSSITNDAQGTNKDRISQLEFSSKYINLNGEHEIKKNEGSHTSYL